MFQLYIILQEEVEGTQWGKAGPGGAYWRSSALTGQGFFDKMVFIGFIRIILLNRISGLEHNNRPQKERHPDQEERGRQHQAGDVRGRDEKIHGAQGYEQ